MSRTVLAGYAMVWGAVSVIKGSGPNDFRERFLRGAFSESIAQGDVLALIGHDGSQLLGSQRSGALRLREDSHGLAYELDLSHEHSSIARDIDRGWFRGLSVGVTVDATSAQSWNYGGSLPLRTIARAKLREVSLVRHPAYPQTSVRVLRAPVLRSPLPARDDPLWLMKARLALAERALS
jgi:uncharacterized protein